MLHDRQYIVSQLDLNQSFDEFKAHFTSADHSISFLVNKRDNPTDQLMVFAAEEDKIGMSHLSLPLTHTYTHTLSTVAFHIDSYITNTRP
jgi:DNA-directed RNA polymerase I, II, and III subunit RPABC1